MKKISSVALCCLLAIALLGTDGRGEAVQGGGKKVVAVLPFGVNSAENIDYVQHGIWDMLTSRIAAAENTDVIPKEKVLDAVKQVKTKELTLADVYGIGKTLNADYAVWGSITKIGNSISIDAKLLDVASYKTGVGIFTQSQGMDDVIAKINDFAKSIDAHISGKGTPAGAEPSTAAPPVASGTGSAASPQPATGREAQIIAGIRTGKRGTLTAGINPDFLSGGQPMDKRGFWMSQRYPTEFRGMDVGDVNGDGKNEIVAIDRNSVYIFQKKGKDLVLLQKITGKAYNNYVGVDIIDIRGDAAKEILVSNIIVNRGTESVINTVSSFVIEYREGKFQVMETDLPWLFRAIPTQDGGVRLLGQKIDSSGGMNRPFDTPIYEMAVRAGKITEGQRLKIPLGVCIFGLALDNLGSGREKIITYNEYDRLVVYEETDKDLTRIKAVMGSKELLYTSEEVFGGSNLYVEVIGMDNYGDDVTNYYTYLNSRIIPYDTNKDGRRELIVVRNHSSVGRYMKNVRIFTASEFYNLEWDQMGFVENWHTRKMSGYVADYQIKDADNDGENEVVMALVVPGGSVFGKSSVIASYKITVQ